MNMSCLRRLLAVLAAAAAIPAQADILYVSVNTASLPGDTAAVLLFDLTQGDGVANNTAAITGFNGGGGPLGGATASGGVSGTLPGTVTISDDSAYESLNQAITLLDNTVLSFTVHLTENNIGGGAPLDVFGFYILDEFGIDSLFPTSDPFGALLVATILDGAIEVVAGSTDPDVLTYRLDPDPVPTPAPGSLWLALLGTGLLLGARRVGLRQR